jgi:hypothetical protein
VCAATGTDEPLFMTVTDPETASRGEGDIGATRVPLQPVTGGEPMRCAFAWPGRPGWHRFRLLRTADSTAGDELPLDEFFLRVAAPGEWAADAADRRQRATARRVSSSADGGSPVTIPTPLSPWWPWGLLLFAAGLLWLERRWDDLG